MKIILGLTLLSALFLTGCASDEKKSEPAKPTTAAAPPKMTTEQVQRETASWSPRHRQIIGELTAKYGPPNETTSDSIIWHDNGPWKKTVVKKDEMNNPLEQTAAMEVPPEKMGDVALFNKSVVIDNTEDQVTSSANKEDLNFLAINLTQEIVSGNMSPMEARRQYSSLTDATDKSRYLKGFEAKPSAPSTLEAQEAEEAPAAQPQTTTP